MFLFCLFGFIFLFSFTCTCSKWRLHSFINSFIHRFVIPPVSYFHKYDSQHRFPFFKCWFHLIDDLCQLPQDHMWQDLSGSLQVVTPSLLMMCKTVGCFREHTYKISLCEHPLPCLQTRKAHNDVPDEPDLDVAFDLVALETVIRSNVIETYIFWLLIILHRSLPHSLFSPCK